MFSSEFFLLHVQQQNTVIVLHIQLFVKLNQILPAIHLLLRLTVIKIPLGQPCSAGEVCQDPYAICAGTCQCHQNYYQAENNTCGKIVYFLESVTINPAMSECICTPIIINVDINILNFSAERRLAPTMST